MNQTTETGLVLKNHFLKDMTMNESCWELEEGVERDAKFQGKRIKKGMTCFQEDTHTKHRK
jgi:hypothetical protein